jgi:hypothetical protein
MKCVKIQCTRSEEHADRWTLITDTGDAFPYSKLFKDKSVDAWLEKGHIIGHKTSEDGMIETWAFID